MAHDETGRRVLWDDGAGLSLWLADDPSGPTIELVTASPEVRVLVPAGSADPLAALVEDRSDAGDPASQRAGEAYRRLAASLAAMDHDGRHQLRWSEPAGWCEQAGVPFEVRMVWPDGTPGRRIKRWHPLLRAPVPSGHIRTLSVELRPETTGYRAGITFSESYRRPDEQLVDYDHGLGTDYSSLDALVGFFARLVSSSPIGDPEERLIACVAALVARGELGAPGPPRRDRDRMLGWWREAGVAYRLTGRDRQHRLVECRQPGTDRVFTLELAFWTNRPSPEVEFIEWHRPPGAAVEGSRYAVSTPLDAAPALATYLSQRQDLAGTGSIEDRLVAGFEAVVATGELGPGRPHRHNRDTVAGWLAAAGADCQVRGTAREERLLKVHRESTDCGFTLWLELDPGGDRISFSERYDYLPRPGDPEREYAYGVRTPYASLAALVDLLAPGGGEDPEDRLVAGFATLVARGELADGLGLRENRDRVAGWFAAAGVSHEPTTSSWFNSD
jgi:hypothetical protein